MVPSDLSPGRWGDADGFLILTQSFRSFPFLKRAPPLVPVSCYLVVLVQKLSIGSSLPDDGPCALGVTRLLWSGDDDGSCLTWGGGTAGEALDVIGSIPDCWGCSHFANGLGREGMDRPRLGAGRVQLAILAGLLDGADGDRRQNFPVRSSLVRWLGCGCFGAAVSSLC